MKYLLGTLYSKTSLLIVRLVIYPAERFLFGFKMVCAILASNYLKIIQNCRRMIE